MARIIFSFILIIASISAHTQTPPGLSLIKEQQLRSDLAKLADAHFKGRSAGTIDELKASAWLAEEFRKIGLKPMGDDGSYLQFFSLARKQVSPTSTISINNKPLRLWQDVSVSQMANTSINEPIIFLGDAANIDTNTLNVQGKVVALVANSKGIDLNISLPTWRYNRYIHTKYEIPLIRRGAKAIIFIADDEAEKGWADATENFKRGTYDLVKENGIVPALPQQIPVIWMRKGTNLNNATLQLNLFITEYTYPSANIIGYIPGTDPKLKSEYLLYSGHTDAHGIRNPVNGDSIYYGADDNGSVDVAMMANARAFAKYPAKRSVIFVIHGAEERGLFGSRYYSEFPTVPLKNIVAVLNGDMIGRNNTDSAAFLGMVSPHRNSKDLVKMTLDANNEGPKFKLDSSWDSPSHPEFWYFRSDHLPYARLGIPAIMYSSLLHPDYHTPLDNIQKINYPKLKKMADWMYRTGWKVANAPGRPATDQNFKLER